MTLPRAITAQFRDTVTVRLATGLDAYNDPVFSGAAITVPCRISHTRTSVATAGGTELQVSTVIHMEDIAGFSADAQIVLPDGSTHSAQTFDRPAWPNGTRHLKVVL